MVRVPLRRVVVPVLAAMAGTGVLVGCGAGSSVFGGCTDRDVRLTGKLAELRVLDLHPGGATLTDSYADCDTDDGFAYAGRQYRSDLDRREVMTFYRIAAAADGWRFYGMQSKPSTGGLVVSAPGACYVKEVDGTGAYLKVWFPADLNVPDASGPQASSDLYGVDVSASHDGAAWC
jgi:hypothetical protein